MEMQQISALGKFLEEREKKIVELAQKATTEIVNKEMALMDFELLLSANLSDEESEELTKRTQELREENWKILSEKFNNNAEAIQKAVIS